MAVMLRGQRLHDGQAEAEAFIFAAELILELAETGKRRRDVFRRDADARVRDGNDEARRPGIEPHGDGAALDIELDRIADEVGEDLADLALIGKKGGQTGRCFQRTGDAGLARLHPRGIEHLAGDFLDADFLFDKRVSAGFDA